MSPNRVALSGPFLAVLLTGCLGMPDVDRPTASATATSPERAAAIADMRAQAVAGDQMPYPDAFQTAETSRLVLRDEPRSLGDAREIEAELAQIADRRALTNDPTEIAALDERARQLRRLALATAGADDVLR